MTFHVVDQAEDCYVDSDFVKGRIDGARNALKITHPEVHPADGALFTQAVANKRGGPGAPLAFNYQPRVARV